MVCIEFKIQFLNHSNLHILSIYFLINKVNLKLHIYLLLSIALTKRKKNTEEHFFFVNKKKLLLKILRNKIYI